VLIKKQKSNPSPRSVI